MTPSPEQIQAAMPAMREWLRRDDLARRTKGFPALGCRNWAEARPDEVVRAVEARYRQPGGVAQFIKDQEERRG